MPAVRTLGEEGHEGELPGRLTQKRGLRMIGEEFTPGQLRAMYGPLAAEDVAMVEATMQDYSRSLAESDRAQ